MEERGVLREEIKDVDPAAQGLEDGGCGAEMEELGGVGVGAGEIGGGVGEGLRGWHCVARGGEGF